MRTPLRPWQADLLLVALTMIWGTTFVLVKDTLATVPPLVFLAMRFSVGAAALLPFALARQRSLPVQGSGRADRRTILGFGPAELAGGALAGLFMFGGFALQTAGLVDTTPARAGFLTGLSVVLVPLMLALAGVRTRWPVWVGVALATAGLFLLAHPQADAGFSRGDLLVLGCAVAFALNILAVDRYAGILDPVRLAFVETVVVAVGNIALTLLVPHATPHWTPVAWAALLVCGLLATAAGNVLQTSAQRFTTPAHTALIFTLEPVFALVTSWLFWGERWSMPTLVGGLCVLLGMLASELPLARPSVRR